ncbi:hypothetical protein T492DRAFT_961082 [Pavlovales sp. CCMP2436]|nr:hypothetical protein T492DRAFT_961082 [Pavlovales sp. CCMP2436]
MEPKRTRRLRAHRDYSLPRRPRSSHRPAEGTRKEPRRAPSIATATLEPPPLCAPARRQASRFPSLTRRGARHPEQPRRAARATAAALTRRHRCAPRLVGAPRMLACTLGPQLHAVPHHGLFGPHRTSHRTRPRAVQARVNNHVRSLSRFPSTI